MKKISKISLILCLLTAMFLGSCSKSDEPATDKLLIGEWAEAPSTKQLFIKFNEGGTAVLWYIFTDEDINYEAHYTYKYDSAAKMLTMTNPVDGESKLKVLELTDKILKLENVEDGEKLTLYRQK